MICLPLVSHNTRLFQHHRLLRVQLPTHPINTSTPRNNLPDLRRGPACCPRSLGREEAYGNGSSALIKQPHQLQCLPLQCLLRIHRDERRELWIEFQEPIRIFLLEHRKRRMLPSTRDALQVSNFAGENQKGRPRGGACHGRLYQKLYWDVIKREGSLHRPSQ